MATAADPNPSLLRLLGPTALTKFAVMGLTGLIGLFTTRLIIGTYGTENYQLYALISTLPALLPFADLGMAAVILNAVGGSTDARNDPEVRQAIVTAMRILTSSGLVITAVCLLITLLGAWPLLLGADLAGAELLPLACLAVFSAALPFTVGPRVLIGLGRTTTQIASTALTAPFIFVAVQILAHFAPPAAGRWLALVPYVAAAVVVLVAYALAWRAIDPQLRQAIKLVPRVRSYKGMRALHVAGPMLLQSLVLPLAMHTDRLLLSHFTQGSEVAQYSLAAQLYGIVNQTIMATGVALWPVYARARKLGEINSPARATWLFALTGLGAALALTGLLGWLWPFISHGRFEPTVWLLAGFVFFLTMEATKYPAGMYMTDERGLKFQIIPVLALVPLNIGLSIALIGPLGAAGPIWGSAIAVLVCQVIPYHLYVRRDLRHRRAGQRED